MKVVILCGGFGTRISDVEATMPKPMLPIGGYPILWHIMKYYSTWQHNKFVLCLGYKSEIIKDYFLNYSGRSRDLTLVLGDDAKPAYHTMHQEAGWEVTLADTGADSLTGARVHRVANHLGDADNFMLTYGDGVSNIDIDRLCAFHQSHGKILTVAAVHPPGRFGELELDANGLISGFNEKPQVSTGRISGGFFVCRREFLNYLDDGANVMLEEEPMRKLVSDGQVMAYKHDDFWHPMDTRRDYNFLNKLWDEGQAPWKKW